ncbi:hypothetical protein N800_06890 [Lysobacter daejeonensis GH1-9]|uniref:Uncharacterized protein n=1 Tax=Lysobacter daejeonensis GH1-9 TaxID=1385517 RepID=A0A0A0EQB9_9GAMM|nr:hypothetical protein [Lysobacter daejeonensis]KGM53191.1 hypothetical protein N800_06890 [Lysobacter daejeonensis GH1-9]
MNASSHFPASLHWSAQELAAAVPLRLFELLDFDAPRDDARAANNAATPRRALRAGYACNAALPAHFHVHR